ncbi:MAG: GGDEF domain-containing protein [Gemmatimonadales bacterium]|nr:MAG: GGDEF domain-containing protein [Gemmatimonadales bacterium]
MAMEPQPSAPAELLDRIFSSKSLPSAPAVAIRLLELADDPDSEVRAMAAVLAMDPVLAARVLRASNSAYFGSRVEIRSLEDAIPLLGRAAVTSLALSFSLSDKAMRVGPLAHHYRRFWLRCAVQASAAETLSRFGIQAPAGELFMQGLLLDLGQLALLKTLGAEYGRILDEASRGEAGGERLVALERERLGLTHALVGAAWIARWGLPHRIHVLVEHHHAPAGSVPESLEADGILAAMRIASVVGDCFLRLSPTTSLTSLASHLQDRLRLPDDQVLQFLLAADHRVTEAVTLLSADAKDRMTAVELMAEAAEHWSSMALQQGLGQDGSRATRELVQENDELRRQVFLDPLTRLYNRRFVDEMLRQDIDTTPRGGGGVALLFLDLDRFKSVNDTHGHVVGDRILIEVAHTLQRGVRGDDLVARYGGEEFVILVRNPSVQGLVGLASRLREAVESLDVQHNGSPVPVTLSVGGAMSAATPSATPDIEALVVRADQAMYASKHRGRNRITIRTPEGSILVGPEEILQEAGRETGTERPVLTKGGAGRPGGLRNRTPW